MQICISNNRPDIITYTTSIPTGTNVGTYPIRDGGWAFFLEHRDDGPRELAHAVVNHEHMWGRTLAAIPGFEEAVAADLERIQAVGMYEAIRVCLSY